MASFAPFTDDQPFEEKVKCLADEELLDIWAQSQQIESIVPGRMSSLSISRDYERAIINELSLRSSRGLQINC